jgi:hypothetical protein
LSANSGYFDECPVNTSGAVSEMNPVTSFDQ